MLILLIEDDPRVSGFIARGLKAEGHRCVVVANGEEGLAHGLHGDQDLIILDRMLPGRDGLAICQRLRAAQVQTPILMLTAMDAVEERVDGLRAGADDYLTKPFDFEELLARIDALSRRQRAAPDDDTLTLGPLRISPPARGVQRDGRDIVLTGLEFDLLLLLARHTERFWSRERILNRIWGTAEDPQTNIVDVYISRLRKKLDHPGEASLIENRRGVGYRLRVPPTDSV
jgi:DNA-binding response OmpR family regulator